MRKVHRILWENI